MIDPGNLDRRLTLEVPVETPDGAGGTVRSFEDAAALWASVEPVSARSSFDADAGGARVTHRIVIRARAGITTRHRLRDGERTFAIVALRERGRGYLEIAADERVG